jgi:hypothetical protein
METPSTKSTTHAAVALARIMLITCGLSTSWTVWLIVAKPGSTAVIVVGVLPLLLSFVLYRRWIRHATATGEPPSLAAWVPTLCVVVSLLAYGAVLTQVHEHYFVKRSNAYDRALRHNERGVHAHNAALAGREKVLLRQLARLRSSRRSPLEISELRRLTEILKQGHGDLLRVEVLTRSAGFAKAGLANTLVASLSLLGRYQSVYIPLAPSAMELPPWFGRLGGFFMVATQVLAGLVIVLAFTRWSARGSSEEVFRTAMPIAVAGVAFGLAGNLPSLSRPLQAIILGPVIAGLAGALGALLVAVTASRPPDVRKA